MRQMKILISRPDKIGDVTLALHSAKQLKILHPEWQVYMFLSEYTKSYVENIKFIDGIITDPKEIKQEKFDAVIDLMAKSEMAKIFYKSGIKTRIGNSARWFSFMYSQSSYIRRSKALINEAEYNWQLVSLLDKKYRYSRLVESLNSLDFKNIKEYDEFKDYIILMPSITVSAVALDYQKWFETSKLLIKKYPNKKIIFLLGPAEKELNEKLRLDTFEYENIVVREFSNFPELLGFIKNCSFYVGTSTGITHIASALGCCGLAIYPEIQSMHPRRWTPFNSKLKVISLNKKLSPEIIVDALENDIPLEFDPLKRKKISAFIICCDEERNIRRALESVKWCDQILVVDSGSKDKTVEIVKEYTDNIIIKDWPGHRAQKQFALEKCTNDWVLNIDSDEEVSMQLRGEIEKVLRSKNPRNGYNLNRLIYYMDRWWDKGGWHPEYRLRLFNKNFTSWGGNDPHEKAIVKGRVRKLNGFLYHYTYQSIEHHIECLKNHSINSAKFLFKNKQKAYMYNIVLNPAFRFFKFYIMKMGFREGFTGFVVALLESYNVLLKYIVLWNLQNKNK